METQKEVENTKIMSEGGDTKVTQPKVKEEKPKKPSALQEDGSYKVDLSKTLKTEKDAGKILSKGDESKVSNKEPDKESGEEKKKEREVETPVLEEITDSEEKTEETTVKEKTKEPVLEKETKKTTPGMELPENVEKLVKFMNETGGTLEEYVRLNADYSKVDDSDLLRSYYEQTKSHLSHDEINFMIEDNFSFDKDIDDTKDVKRKQLAYKEAVNEARQHLEGLKGKYYEEVKLGSKLLPEQQKAVEFFNRYNKEQEQRNELAVKSKAHFNKETDKVFNDEFKGFDFKVGDKKYRYNVKDADVVKEAQSDVMNMFNKFLDKNQFITNASEYHKTIFAASNADAIANHFYEQGKADAIKQVTSDAKNINMDPRKTDSGIVETQGQKYKVISGDDSSKLKFKLKNY
jgi:hypothetical protein